MTSQRTAPTAPGVASGGVDSATTPAAIRDRLDRTTAWAEARGGGEAIAAALEVARSAPEAQVERLATARRIVVTGAGSSFHVALVAAAAMTERCGLPAVAAPLSEVLLRPHGVFAPGEATDQPVVVVSRSGTTTEAIEVVRAVRERRHPTVAVTCRPGSAMAGVADDVLSVPEGDERSIVMTRSVAALSALLMRLGSRLGSRLGPGLGGRAFADDLDRVPGAWPATHVQVERALELAADAPSRVVVLGGGPAYGLACEAVLKLTETSRIPASAYHPLEFRHGPIAVCEPGVLVIGLLGGAAVDVERRVLEESAALGATAWTLGPDGPGGDLDEIARLPLVLHPLQALALAIAAQRGLDPDRPRHLGQVVVLGGD